MVYVKRYNTQTSTRRSLLNLIVALNPDSFNTRQDNQIDYTHLAKDGMKWLDPILSESTSRIEWENATLDATSVALEAMKSKDIDGAETLLLPATFFRSEPVIVVLGSYLILLYILPFSFLSGFNYIFKKTCGSTPGYQGSCFAAIAAGITAFALCGPGLYEWARQHTGRVRGAALQPEFRLWPAIVTSPLLPISLFWLGWTNYASISIWGGLGACFLFGIVLTSIYVSSYEYITDSYGEHSAIALASITMSRYLVAGGMVMATHPMYEVIGVQWTMSILGCIAVLLTPAPVLFWKYGPRLREKSPYATTDVHNIS
ncbi:hypothetical protein FSARC_3672 [Fusarium sarcochroum]|uniref:Uncharacterized protein n=1 Tax=Fusarium sarcochroum TaxID=1208366 RepID=A0A8H4XBH2_9HYPO|nr:hypothetical protein FSARC_3672 [Fusarium sarcochroum]